LASASHPPRCARCVIRRCKQQNRSIKSTRAIRRNDNKDENAALPPCRGSVSRSFSSSRSRTKIALQFSIVSKGTPLLHTHTHSLTHTYIPPYTKTKTSRQLFLSAIGMMFNASAHRAHHLEWSERTCSPLGNYTRTLSRPRGFKLNGFRVTSPIMTARYWTFGGDVTLAKFAL
jgi:hypothetical protein